MSDEAIASGLDDLLTETIRTLESLDIHEESLGVLKPAKGFAIFKTAASMVPAGKVWRLGVLLIDRDHRVYATGEVTRALEPKIAVTNRSKQADLRRADRLAASRGPFPPGEVVNHLFTELATDPESLRAGSGPLSVQGETVMVRWDHTRDEQAIMPLDAYFKDRVSLLILD